MIHQTREDRIDELLSDLAFHPDITDLLEHNGITMVEVIEDLANAAQGNVEKNAPLSPENVIQDLLRHWLTIAMDNEDERASSSTLSATSRYKPMTTRYTVQGRGAFPIDMLRYDACYPATEQDAGLIEDLLRHPHIDRNPHEVTIETHRTPRTHAVIVTWGRWESFGWTVTEATR